MIEHLLSWLMMGEFIHWPKPYLLLSTTCDEIVSWMLEIWMKKQLVSDNNYNIVNLYPPKFSQRMTKYVGLTFSVSDTISQFTTSIEQDN
jgi:hypothetical protein